MADTRHRNVDWTIHKNVVTGVVSWEGAQLAVLMDIRDELQALNRIIGCPNFVAVPQTLREIRDRLPVVQPPPRYRCRCQRPFPTRRSIASHIGQMRRRQNGSHGMVRA